MAISESLTALLDELYTITGRPDLVAESKSAIKSATLRAHHSDFYARDMAEQLLTMDEAAYIHSWDYIATASNFRALKYIRKVEDGVPTDLLEMIPPDLALDSYGVERTNICYIAGRVIEIKCATEVDTFIVGYYVSPIVTDANYSSWVADQYPYVILFEAARLIFKMVGFDEQSAMYDRLSQEQFADLRVNALGADSMIFAH